MSDERDRIRFELQLLLRAGITRLPGVARDLLTQSKSSEPAPPGKVAKPATARIPLEELTRSTPVEPLPATSSLEERQRQLDTLAGQIRDCQRCKLCEKRTKAVPGEGTLDPPILFIGEGPGRDEDHSGRPFVGRAGQLLEKMIAAIGLDREDVFIANIVKCRPPANRTPEPDEVRACSPYLEQQIALLRPRLICTLGLPSTRTLVPSVRSISAARGRQFLFQNVPLIPTFHPAYLLRTPSAKQQAWSDLKLVARLALDKIID